MKETQRNYGDENAEYDVLAKDMSPKDAHGILETNINDGIYEAMPEQRRNALRIRAKEKK